MRTLFVNDDRLDELVFENRNRAYGAYALRKSYDANMNKAVAGTFLFLAVLSILSAISFKKNPVQKVFDPVKPAKNDVYRIVEVELQRGLNTAPQPPKPNALNFRISTDPPPSTTPDPDPVPNPGQTAATGQTGTTNMGGPGPGTMPAPTPTPPSTGTETWVQVMPSFPGGENALQDYIRENIRFPRLAMENGISGKVIVSFVVDEEGLVKDIQIVKSLGFGCDDEAERVLAEMPRWSPGQQHQRKVAVRMFLPILFVLQ